MQYIYAALLLHKAGKPVDEVHLKKVLEATGNPVDESKIKVLVASLKGVDITKELETATTRPVAPTGTGAAVEAKKEEKKEEKKREATAEGLAALFG